MVVAMVIKVVVIFFVVRVVVMVLTIRIIILVTTGTKETEGRGGNGCTHALPQVGRISQEGWPQ